MIEITLREVIALFPVTIFVRHLPETIQPCVHQAMGYGPLFFIDPLQTYRTKGADGGTWEGRTTSMDSRGTWEMVVHSHTLCRPKPAMSTLSPLSYFPTSYGAFSFTVISQKVTIKSSSLAYALLLKKSHFY